MTLKEMLSANLPQSMVGPRGEITIYTIGAAIGYRPQSVSEWFRKDQITIPCVKLLMQIEGNTLSLSDFVPFCPDLKLVLDMIDNEAVKAGTKNEY